MELNEAMKARHSVRRFTDQKVDLVTIKDILKEAQSAPSWVNSQPYKIYLATGASLERIRQQYEQLSQKGEKGNPDLHVMSRKLWSKQGRENMATWTTGLSQEQSAAMGEESARLYNAPAILFMTLPKGYSGWSLYDLGAFDENIVLGATDRGIGSMTAYQLIKYPAVLRKELAIPADEDIIIGIALGYEDRDAVVNSIESTRMNLDDILSVNE